MGKPSFPLCKRGLHEKTYANSFVDHRGCTCCRACYNAAKRRQTQRRRERDGYEPKQQTAPEKIQHYVVCRMLGLSIDTAAYVTGITEWEGKKIERLDIRPV